MPLTHETETFHEVEVPLYSLLVERNVSGFTLSFQSKPIHEFFKKLSGGKTEQLPAWGLECFQLGMGKIPQLGDVTFANPPVSYTHLRAHETPEHLVCRLL